MENKQEKIFRILVVGIGGVGGYFGGKLAAHYALNDTVEVGFFARGAHAAAIADNGLRLQTTQGELTAKPAYITYNPADLHPVDLLICCVKSYDLEESLLRVQPAIGAHTIVLPLLNGIDAPDRIRKLLPDALVWQGCVYVVARLETPGLVKENGGGGLLYFGDTNARPEQLRQVESILKAAGIKAEAPAAIDYAIWSKFLFISAAATATSYLDLPIHAVVATPERKQLVRALLGELQAVANAHGIILADDLLPPILERMAALSPEVTTSMHSDFRKGGKTELESLTGYVVRQGHALQVPVPTYEKLYAAMLQRTTADKV